MIFLKRRAMMTRASFNYKTVNGIGSITLENCVETKFKRLMLSGNSMQGENPSIESPKEIKNSGKYDETSGKYVIDMKVTGKNLLEGFEIGGIDNQGNIVQNITTYININKFIEVEEGKHIINSRDGKRFLCAMFLYDKDKQFIRIDQSGDCIVRTGEKYVNISAVNSFIDGTDKLQIELEDKNMNPTPYEPYHEPQTVQLQLDEPLRGIGEYKDVITKDGILRKIKEIVLDESTGFKIYWATLNKTFAFISPTIKDATVINFTPNRLLCNYFKALPDSFDRTDEEVCVLFNRRFHIRFLKERNIDTVEKLKEWLKQNPIKIQYLLQEPILEPLENSLENLHANDGTTVINVDSGEVETGIEVEYAVKE